MISKLYPISDHEIYAFYPLFEFNVAKKNFLHKWLGPITYHISFLSFPLIEIFKDKILGAIKHNKLPLLEEALPLVHLALLLLISDKWYHALGFFYCIQVFSQPLVKHFVPK